jgi:prepilin-type N-terminal cleavage/methylation domain-containing protein
MKIRFENRFSRIGGMSLIEIMVTVGILGVLASVGSVAFENIHEKSKEAIARSIVEKLNKATHDYNHAYKPLDTPFLESSGGDEKAILMTLQYREPVNPGVGEPYMRPDWKPVRTSDTDEYRYVWRGRNWDLLLPGESGAGLKVQFDATDIGEMVTFPSGYTRFRTD